jgi:hypothetical protein
MRPYVVLRLRLQCYGLRGYISENFAGHVLQKGGCMSANEKIVSWCGKLADFRGPAFDSVPRTFKGRWQGWLAVRFRRERQRGLRRPSERERQPLFERQRLERRVPSSVRVPVTRYFSCLLGGSFASNPFFHPPSIRPISSSFAERSAYCSVGTSLFSHAS